MPELKYGELLKKIRDLYLLSKDTNNKSEIYKQLDRIYLIYGANGFVRNRAVQRLKSIAVNSNATIDRVIFEKTVDFNGWISSLYDIPMFSSEKLIIASELSSLEDKQIEALVEYSKNPSPDIVLILLSEKLNTKKNIIKNLLSNVVACKDEIGKKDDITSMMRAFAKERGKDIDREAIEFLTTRFDLDLSAIEKEIEKVVAYIGDRTTINARDIEFLSTGVGSCGIFDVYPMLAAKNKNGLLRVAHLLVEAGEHPILINSIISTRLQKLLLAMDLIKNNEDISDVELAGKLAVNPKSMYFFKSELKKYKRQELANMYKRCMNIDSELKSSKRDSVDILFSGLIKLLERV